LGAGDAGDDGSEGATLGADADGGGSDFDVGPGVVCAGGEEEGCADGEAGVGA
jgi:hypothetical protein